MYHWFYAISKLFNRKYGSNITNFEIFMKIKVKISKNLKIGDIGSIFSVEMRHDPVVNFLAPFSHKFQPVPNRPGKIL